MKHIYFIIVFVGLNCVAEQNKSPEEAHLYFKNRVTNSNSPEMVAEYKAETSAQTQTIINGEKYSKELAERDVKIKELEKRVTELERIAIALLFKVIELEKGSTINHVMAAGGILQ